jgi:polyvinyl alcohol dehydrogenase (cytochrome)
MRTFGGSRRGGQLPGRPLNRRSIRTLLGAGVAVLALAATAQPVAAQPVAARLVTARSASAGPAVGRPVLGAWPSGGHDASNSRFNPFERLIGPRTAGRLVLRWSAPTAGDVSATPAVVGGAVYFPDFGGMFWKLDARTGAVIWSRRVADYTGVTGDVSRTSPAVTGHTVYIGDLSGAHLMAIDTRTGDLRWMVQLDSHPAAILTQSPLVRDGVVYEGVSSGEEALAANPTYPCCTFRGSLSAVDAATGAVRWKRFMLPDNGGRPGGYSGNAVWSSTPAVDPSGRTVYITTGNNYDVPASVTACQSAGGSAADCLAPDDHLDAVVALDTRTGRIRWATGVQGFDAWNIGCRAAAPPNNCPNNPGQDFDFGDGAHLFTVRGANGQPRQLVGAGQKSGSYWALDARTGQIVWSAAPGPGSSLGGIEWGTAFDGRRIYLAEANFAALPTKLPDGSTVTAGSFAALDPATGRVLWQVADPAGAGDQGAVSVANGVMFGGSLSGRMFALDAATGALLWQFQGQGSSNAGPAIVGGNVFWGNGYARLRSGGTGARTFYAFTLG